MARKVGCLGTRNRIHLLGVDNPASNPSCAPKYCPELTSMAVLGVIGVLNLSDVIIYTVEAPFFLLGFGLAPSFQL